MSSKITPAQLRILITSVGAMSHLRRTVANYIEPDMSLGGLPSDYVLGIRAALMRQARVEPEDAVNCLDMVANLDAMRPHFETGGRFWNAETYAVAFAAEAAGIVTRTRFEYDQKGNMSRVLITLSRDTVKASYEFQAERSSHFIGDKLATYIKVLARESFNVELGR